MGEMEKKTNPSPYERYNPDATALVPKQHLHVPAGARTLRRCDVDPSRKRPSAGMLVSQETLGLSAAIPARETGEETQARTCKQGALLEPEAGCWLWPLVLQNLGSAPADANRRLWSTQCSICL